MIVFGIDPGPRASGWALWNGVGVLDSGHSENEVIIGTLYDPDKYNPEFSYDVLAIERVSCYMKTVGAPIFETCEWVGRFDAKSRAILITRREVRVALCDTARCGDAQVARAIRDRFGEKGTKKSPGPFFGVSGHAWNAVAVAVVAFDQSSRGRGGRR